MVRGSGGGWVLRCRNFQLNCWANNKRKNSPLNWSINLLLFILMLWDGALRGVGFEICKEGWQKMVCQGQQVPIKYLSK
jgi:hypothetical protein